MDDKKTVIFEIVPMTQEHIRDINEPNQPFIVFGRLIPSFSDGKWTWTEEIFKTTYEKQYSDDRVDCGEYMDNPDKIIYMAYADRQCAGRMRLKRNWNRYCLIEDIAVCSRFRGMGLGRKLIDTAVQWAKSGNMPGLMLETQDVSLAACRFYHRCGFILGGVDTMLYGNSPYRGEKALFWYRMLD